MCVDQRKSFKLNKFGYKWLVKVDGKYYPPNNFPTNKPLEGLGVSQKAKNCRTTLVRKDIGFHIFNKLSEARRSRWGKIWLDSSSPYVNIFNNKAENILLKVKYSLVKYTGIGDGLDSNDFEVIVAKEMTLLKEIES